MTAHELFSEIVSFAVLKTHDETAELVRLLHLALVIVTNEQQRRTASASD